MNKKLLATLLYVTAATPLLAMQHDPDQNAVVAHMKEMEPITIPLQKSSIDYINNTSKWSALAGAFTGLGAGYLILQNESQQLLQQPAEILRKIAIPTVSTFLAGGVGYYAGKFYAESQPRQEEILQKKVNNVISQHNKMISATLAVRFNEKQRNQINNLPFENLDDKSRLKVYKGLYDIKATKYIFCPINTLTNEINNAASQLPKEKDKVNALEDSVNIFEDDLLQKHAPIADQIKANIRYIKRINDILTPDRLTTWASYVSSTPEYKRENLESHLFKMLDKLETKAFNIVQQLHRLKFLIQNQEHQKKIDDIRQKCTIINDLISDYVTSNTEYKENVKHYNSILHTMSKDVSKFISKVHYNPIERLPKLYCPKNIDFLNGDTDHSNNDDNALLQEIDQRIDLLKPLHNPSELVDIPID